MVDPPLKATISIIKKHPERVLLHLTQNRIYLHIHSLLAFVINHQQLYMQILLIYFLINLIHHIFHNKGFKLFILKYLHKELLITTHAVDNEVHE